MYERSSRLKLLYLSSTLSFFFLYILCFSIFFFFFFNDTATTEIYTLSLHDALPIWALPSPAASRSTRSAWASASNTETSDRKSTRLNSSHSQISYAVFCLKKKKKKKTSIKISTIKNIKKITKHVFRCEYQRRCRRAV